MQRIWVLYRSRYLRNIFMCK